MQAANNHAPDLVLDARPPIISAEEFSREIADLGNVGNTEVGMCLKDHLFSKPIQ